MTGVLCYSDTRFCYLIPGSSPKKSRRSYVGYDSHDGFDSHDGLNGQDGHNDQDSFDN